MGIYQPHWIRGTVGGSTAYYEPMGFLSHPGSFSTAEASHTLLMDAPGTARRLKVILTAAPGGATSRTFTFRKGGADQSLTVTISGSNTSGTDDSNSFTWNAGDTLVIRHTISGSPAAAAFVLVWEGETDADNRSIYIIASGEASQGTSTTYGSMFSSGRGWDTNAIEQQSLIGTAGTIPSYSIKLSVASGASASRTFVIEKSTDSGVTWVAQDGTGGTPNTTLTLTGSGSGSGITFGTATFSLSVAAGDLVRMKMTTSGSPSNSIVMGTHTFNATADGLVVVSATPDVAPTNAAVSYTPGAGGPSSSPWSTTDAGAALPAPRRAFNVSGMYVVTDTTIATQAHTYTLYKNGSGTSESATVAVSARNSSSPSSTIIALADGDSFSTSSASATIGSGEKPHIVYVFADDHLAPVNTAPTVDAGIDQELNCANSAVMDAEVTDDGNPDPPGAVTYAWTKESGPGTATFSPSNTVLNPTVTFSATGTYVLRLTASDSLASAFDEVTIDVNSIAPVVSAGADQSAAAINSPIQLAGSASAGTLAWTKQSGPGTATFSDATIAAPTVQLSAEGIYVLRLTATDGACSTYDEMTITVLSTVAPGPSICTQDYVLTWISQTYFIVDDTTKTFLTSTVPLNDLNSYYGGVKRARIVDLPTIARRLSDTRGQWEAGTMRWREAETDLLFRSRVGIADDYPITNATDICYMITEENYRDGGDARLMFVGHRLRSIPREDFSIEHESGDQLARDLIKAGQEIQTPTRVFESQYTVGVPTDLLGRAEPTHYGLLTDANSSLTPPELIASSATGGFMDGTFPNHGHAPMPGPVPPASLGTAEGAGSLQSGDVPADTYHFNIAGLNASGEWGDPTYFDLNADVAHVLSGSGKSITVSWTNPGTNTAATWRVMMGYTFTGNVRIVQYIDVAGTATNVTFDNMPSHAEIQLGDYSQLATGAAVAPGGFYHYRVAAVLNTGQLTAVNDATNTGFCGYHGYLRVGQIEVDIASLPVGTTHVRVWRVPPGWIAGQSTLGYLEAPVSQTNGAGHVYVNDDWVGTGLTIADPPIERGKIDITALYGGQEIVPYDGQYWHRWFVAGHAVKSIEVYLDQVGGYTAPTKLVGEYGVDWLAPGKTGYTARFTTNYRDFNGRRYTVVYGRGPTADALAEGTGTIRVNLEGVETNADTTGTLLTDIHDQFKHWFLNYFIGDYQTGAWLTSPTWEPIASWPKVDTASWDNAKILATAAFGASVVGGGSIMDLAGKRTWLARWLLSTGLRIGINAGGQWAVTRWDPLAEPERTYTEQRHVVAGSVSFDPLHDEHWTRIKYQFGITDDTWQTSEVIDDIAEDDYEEERPGPIHDLYFVQTSTVAQFIMNAALDRHSVLPWRVVFETLTLCGTDNDLGDVIGLTATWGLHVDGWEHFPLFIEGHETVPERHVVRFTTRTNVAPHTYTP